MVLFPELVFRQSSCTFKLLLENDMDGKYFVLLLHCLTNLIPYYKRHIKKLYNYVDKIFQIMDQTFTLVRHVYEYVTWPIAVSPTHRLYLFAGCQGAVKYINGHQITFDNLCSLYSSCVHGHSHVNYTHTAEKNLKKKRC